jgi:cytochrome b561
MADGVKKEFTLTHRILHWSVTVLMFILFITGFLRINWMARRVIQNAVTQNTQGLEITKAQMSGISKNIISPMWDWHVVAAYIMGGAFIIRLIYMAARGIRFPNPFQANISLKDRLQGSLYALFYLFVAVSVITGFYLKWIDGDLKDIMETIHKWAIYWFPVFVVLHFAGIWLAEQTNRRGVTSRMIGGE